MLGSNNCEGIFLKRIANKNASLENAIFLPDPEDEAAFAKDVAMVKLSKALSTGSSSRTRCLLYFKENLVVAGHQLG